MANVGGFWHSWSHFVRGSVQWQVGNSPTVTAFLPRWTFGWLAGELGRALEMDARVYQGRTFGDALAAAIAASIVDQAMREKDPDGKVHKRLSPRYAAWKARHGKMLTINFMDDKMLDTRELKGIVAVSKDRMTMTYGVTEAARNKATWAHEGNRKRNRPKRPFYGIDKDGWKFVDAMCDARIDQHIQSLGARHVP